MDVLPYNDKHKWTDLKTGEKLHWADIAMFEHEGAIENIWMLGFEADEGEKDSHFLILVAASDDAQPPIEYVEHWKEYAFNAYTNQTSEVLIYPLYHLQDTLPNHYVQNYSLKPVVIQYIQSLMEHIQQLPTEAERTCMLIQQTDTRFITRRTMMVIIGRSGLRMNRWFGLRLLRTTVLIHLGILIGI